MRAAGTRGTFNVATGIETSVQELYSSLARVAGSSIEPELLPLREGELERSCMDPSHAGQEFGWRARIPIAEGLVQTYRELGSEFAAREQAGSRVGHR
jgi:UDP-glucose 4-epimerase